MNRQERVARARRQLDEVSADAQSLTLAGPSCLSCVYGPEKSARGICNHPVFFKGRIRIDAPSRECRFGSMTSTTTARAEDGLCGPEGALHQPLPIVARLSRALCRALQ